MNIRLNLLFPTISFVFLLVGLGCQRNVDSSPNPPTPPIDPLFEKVTASVLGKVTDEMGEPVKNAMVLSGVTSTATDVNGVFRFNNIQLSKNAGTVLIEKTGYFRGSRTFFTNANSVNYVEIKLIQKQKKGIFSSLTGGNISIQNGCSVNFLPNSIVNTKEDNTVYNGIVSVFGTYLDPNSQSLFAIMPGNLMGLNTSNQLRLLQTFGMIAIELEGAAGEKLQIATGKTATINMPIPASLAMIAPAEIPLWYFKDTIGLWKEEGVATKQGNSYVGNVSHFSFWNCDIPGNYVNLKVTVKNQAGQILPYQRVRVTDLEKGISTNAFTDSLGIVSGAVPENVPLKVEVVDACNNVFYVQNTGPLSVDTDLGVIKVTITSTGTTNLIVTGAAVDCNFKPVTSGFAYCYLEGLIYRADIINGSFSFTIKRCMASPAILELKVYDAQTKQIGSPISVIVTNGTYNSGYIFACIGTTNQFISYSINGVNLNFATPSDSLSFNRNGERTTINARNLYGSGSKNTFFSFNSQPVSGTYVLNDLYIYKTGGDLYLNENVSTNITEFGTSGQYIAGNFTGNVRDSITNIISPIQGSFRVRRN